MSNEYFIVYDRAAGVEVTRGFGPAGVAAMQRPPAGMSVLALPPDAYHGDLGAAAAAVREALWEAVKAKRQAVIDAGITVDGIGTFDSDADARADVDGAAGAALAAKVLEMPFSVTWTLKDNSTAVLDADQMLLVHMTGVQFINAVHDHGRTLRAAIDGAADVQALLQIDIMAGWPA